MKVLIGDLLWTSYTKTVNGQRVTKWRVEDKKHPVRKSGDGL